MNDVGDVNSPHAGEAGAGVNEAGGTGSAASGQGGAGGGSGALAAGRGGDGGATATVGGSSGTGGGAGDGVGATGGSAATGGTAGTDATGGSGVQEGGSAGVGVDEEEGDCEVSPGCLFAKAPRIRALATDSKRVYWAEYGAKDELGDYSHSGRVLARDLDGKNQRTLLDGLDGPMGLAVTEHYLYVYLDGGRKDDQAASLVRAPLEGGDAVLVLEGATPLLLGGAWCESDCVASNGDVDFFSDQGVVYSLANEAGATPEVVYSGPIDDFKVDDAHLYFTTHDRDAFEPPSSLARVPLAGGTPTDLWGEASYLANRFLVVEQYVYLPEIDGDAVTLGEDYESYLARAPKDGSGPFVRIARLGAYAKGLAFFGERFFADDFAIPVAPDTGHHVVTGLLSDPTVIQALPGLTKMNDTARWKGSPLGVFWAIIDDGQLRFSALP